MIVEALAKGNSEEAERLMREHINFLEARLDATLDKNAGSKKIRMNLASFNVPINKKLSVD